MLLSGENMLFICSAILKDFQRVKIIFRDKTFKLGAPLTGFPKGFSPSPATVATPLVETNGVFENRNGYKWTWR